MVGAVDELDLHVLDGIARQNAGVQRLLDALSMDGMYSLGTTPPTILLTNS